MNQSPCVCSLRLRPHFCFRCGYFLKINQLSSRHICGKFNRSQIMPLFKRFFFYAQITFENALYNPERSSWHKTQAPACPYTFCISLNMHTENVWSGSYRLLSRGAIFGSASARRCRSKVREKHTQHALRSSWTFDTGACAASFRSSVYWWLAKEAVRRVPYSTEASQSFCAIVFIQLWVRAKQNVTKLSSATAVEITRYFHSDFVIKKLVNEPKGFSYLLSREVLGWREV